MSAGKLVKGIVRRILNNNSSANTNSNISQNNANSSEEDSLSDYDCKTSLSSLLPQHNNYDKKRAATDSSDSSSTGYSASTATTDSGCNSSTSKHQTGQRSCLCRLEGGGSGVEPICECEDCYLAVLSCDDCRPGCRTSVLSCRFCSVPLSPPKSTTHRGWYLYPCAPGRDTSRKSPSPNQGEGGRVPTSTPTIEHLGVKMPNHDITLRPAGDRLQTQQPQIRQRQTSIAATTTKTITHRDYSRPQSHYAPPPINTGRLGNRTQGGGGGPGDVPSTKNFLPAFVCISFDGEEGYVAYAERLANMNMSRFKSSFVIMPPNRTIGHVTAAVS